MMSRDDLVHRIEGLSEEELAEVGPYLTADLDVINELQDLTREVELGRQSARDEPLVDDDDVVQSVAERLRRL